MKITDRNIGPYRPEKSSDSKPKDAQVPDRGSLPSVERNKSDRVELSDAARQLAAGHLSQLPDVAADRLQQVRQRILSGAYDADHVVAQVAQRILDRGDV